MAISRESFILAKKDSSGVPGEPVGLTAEGGPESIALMASAEEASQLRALLTGIGPLAIFKVHVVLVGEVL
jgi:hypothetical protein